MSLDQRYAIAVAKWREREGPEVQKAFDAAVMESFSRLASRRLADEARSPAALIGQAFLGFIPGSDWWTGPVARHPTSSTPLEGR